MVCPAKFLATTLNVSSALMIGADIVLLTSLAANCMSRKDCKRFSANNGPASGLLVMSAVLLHGTLLPLNPQSDTNKSICLWSASYVIISGSPSETQDSHSSDTAWSEHHTHFVAVHAWRVQALHMSLREIPQLKPAHTQEDLFVSVQCALVYIFVDTWANAPMSERTIMA